MTDSVIVWTNDSFVARLNFAVDHPKLECLVKHWIVFKVSITAKV